MVTVNCAAPRLSASAFEIEVSMKKIGEILIEAGKVSERDIDRALLAQREMGERIGQVLIKLGLVS